MKISVELSDSEVHQICKKTGIKKKGPAIRKMLVDSLMMEERQAFVNDVLAGKLIFNMEPVAEGREKDRQQSRKRARALSA